MSLSNANILSTKDRRTLLELAQASIQKGLAGREFGVDAGDYSPVLQDERASFVTLHIKKELRGCIGTLEAYQPLVMDVVGNAHAAAFRDPRFPILRYDEFEHLSIHISLLTKPEAMTFTTEADLLAQLQPNVDGLILQEGSCRGTFLPAVWESLPDPQEFLRHLKRKAGLEPDYWSESITVERYFAEEFS